MTKLVASLSFCAASLLTNTGMISAHESAPDQKQTIRGRVISTHCFFQSKPRGVHPQCIEACLKAGQDLALYDPITQTVYFLVGKKPGVDPNTPLKYYAGKTVEVTGRIVQKGNAHGLIIKEVKEQ